MASDYEIFLRRKSEDDELLELIRALSSEDEGRLDTPAAPVPLDEQSEELRETVWQQEPILVPMKPLTPPSRARLLTREDSDASLSIVEDYDNDSIKKYDPEGNEWIEDFLSNFNKVRLWKISIIIDYKSMFRILVGKLGSRHPTRLNFTLWLNAGASC